MKKQILIISFCALLCACNKISNKPIYEELTIDEVGEAMKQDSDFGRFYDDVISVNYAQKMASSQKAKFKKVSYRRFFAYTTYKNNFIEWMKKDSIWGEEWTQLYATEISRTDSVINYWKEYKQNCNSEIDKYIKGKIVNVGIESEYKHNWITDKKEWVSHRTYEIEYTLFVPKVEKVTYDVLFRDEYGHHDYLGFHSGYYDINITQDDNVKKTTLAGCSDRKPSEMWITSIIVNGQEIKSEYDRYDVPLTVRDYMLDETVSNWNNVGREFAGNNFISKRDYQCFRRAKDLENYDNLCYEFDQEF